MFQFTIAAIVLAFAMFANASIVVDVAKQHSKVGSHGPALVNSGGWGGWGGNGGYGGWGGNGGFGGDGGYGGGYGGGYDGGYGGGYGGDAYHG